MENLKLYVENKISMHRDFIELEYFEIADELTLTPAKKESEEIKIQSFYCRTSRRRKTHRQHTAKLNLQLITRNYEY